MYGIVNCHTVKKAREWLKENGIEYEFHDYKKLGIDKQSLAKWCEEFGWESVLNRRGMMWRKAIEADKEKVVDKDSAIEFMLKTPTSIKRPIIEVDEKFLIGFDDQVYEKLLK
ncbi:ArsC family reductase [Candidatus Gracilibacteria bacterium]|nr:ArsC family reductase [Thermales bacterium]NJL96563.1 ArsC family reductase [Candidatus Gracilibacteria bacterium]NJS41296.1 ArsC family reductase [Candidatus Gracilibacteria bacterium]